jgi:membrane-associated phospholipid phosphatase
MLLVVAARMHSGPLHRIDVITDNRVNRFMHRHHAQIGPWKAVTTIGAPTTWRMLAGLAAVGLWLGRRRRQAIVVVVAMVGAAVLSGAVKAIVDRPRPSVPYPIDHVGGGSFPSGHALTSATALALLVMVAGAQRSALARGWLVTVAAVIGVAIGASRVALGVHYPSDVLGGWLLAGLWLFAVTRLGRVGRRRNRRAT